MGLVLVPSEVTKMASALRQCLSDVMDGYRDALQTVINFSNEEDLDTDAWDMFKEKAVDYHDAIVRGMIMVEDSLLVDAEAMEQSVGTEELDEVILDEMITKLEADKKECEAEIERLKRIKNNFVIKFLFNTDWIDGLISTLRTDIYNIETVITFLQDKKQFLYDVESSTQNLFESAINLLKAIGMAIDDAGVEITGVGEVDGSWRVTLSEETALMDEKIKEFIREALQSELNIDLDELEEKCGEGTVELLINIMKDSGLCRLESGNTEKYIESALSAITGYQVTKVDGAYQYVDKDGVNTEVTEDILEVKLEIYRYVKMSEEVAQWYVGNITTYCHMTYADIQANGGPSTKRGRKVYICDLDGSLNGVEVSDDCSSYVWATLVQAGYFDSSMVKYASREYRGGGAATKAMEAAGFVWYPMSRLSGDDLQKGDILVKDGHVEIFYDFNDDGIERALTWGSIYFEEPTEKHATINNINTKYSGIWRLE